MANDGEFTVSVKGVLLDGRRAVLLKNERGEWELPGGKLEPGERPKECLAREIEEELGLFVTVATILDSWVYEVLAGKYVFIVTYGCFAGRDFELRHGTEHKDVGLFGVEDLAHVEAPEEYKDSVRTWIGILHSRESDD